MTVTSENSRRALWRLFVIIVGGGCIVALIAWMRGQCFEPSYTKFTSTTGDFGCPEFWLFRYQQFIGSALAVGAAVAAWIIGLRQIRAMRQQNAVNLRTVVQEMHGRSNHDLMMLHTLRARLEQIRTHLDLLAPLKQNDVGSLIGHLALGDNSIKPYRDWVASAGPPEHADMARTDILRRLAALDKEIDDLKRIMAALPEHDQSSCRADKLAEIKASGQMSEVEGRIRESIDKLMPLISVDIGRVDEARVSALRRIRAVEVDIMRPI